MRHFHVYIMASHSKRLYTGVTSNLQERVVQHRQRIVGHTAKYNITRLAYHEPAPDVRSAIEREKEIKRWTRAKRVALVESMNPTWDDLAETWFAAEQPPPGRRGEHGTKSVSLQDSSLRSE
jgi:putative endonuclease